MKCNICGKRFDAKKENRYEIMKKAVGFNILYDRDKILECFDCPLCGCQNIVNEREIKQEGTKGGGEENGAQTRI